MLLRLINIKKSFGERLLFDIPELCVNDGDRIGIVGRNGCGKTTLLEIMAGQTVSDSGTVKMNCRFGYIWQGSTYDSSNNANAEQGAFESRFGVSGLSGTVSGGEAARKRIAQALSGGYPLLLADEPTCSIDAQGAALVQSQLCAYRGAVIVASHDRELLDAVCNHILAIDGGTVRLYDGNYRKYLELSDAEKSREWEEYEQYKKERARLINAAEGTTARGRAMRTAPKRMGNSEARLHRRGNERGQRAVQESALAIRRRMEQLEKKEKPFEYAPLRFDLNPDTEIGARIAVRGGNITMSYGHKIIFDGTHTDFEIPTGSRTALTGKNGCGKTTLLNMIAGGHEGICTAPGTRTGYFRQDLALPLPDKSLLCNMPDGANTELTRGLLARMGFDCSDFEKPVKVLSGGERVKASLCRVILSGANLLLLDEPTNFLDVYGMEALEYALAHYNGTVVLVSHDRRFVGNFADRVIAIENGAITCREGGFEKADEKPATPPQNRRLMLEMRLAALAARLASPSKSDDTDALDAEYLKTAAELRKCD